MNPDTLLVEIAQNVEHVRGVCDYILGFIVGSFVLTLIYICVRQPREK